MFKDVLRCFKLDPNKLWLYLDGFETIDEVVGSV